MSAKPENHEPSQTGENPKDTEACESQFEVKVREITTALRDLKNVSVYVEIPSNNRAVKKQLVETRNAVDITWSLNSYGRIIVVVSGEVEYIFDYPSQVEFIFNHYDQKKNPSRVLRQ